MGCSSTMDPFPDPFPDAFPDPFPDLQHTSTMAIGIIYYHRSRRSCSGSAAPLRAQFIYMGFTLGRLPFLRRAMARWRQLYLLWI